MYEWPGYGEAPGIPTQNKVFDSIRATYNYLTEVMTCLHLLLICNEN